MNNLQEGKKNEPNLFIIVKKDGNEMMYYNGKDQIFYSDLANATWATKHNDAQGIINLYRLANASVVMIKESEYVFAKANAMTKIIIISESLSRYMQDAMSSLPSKSQEMKVAHKHLKNAANSLKTLLPEFEHVMRRREDDVLDVQGWYEEYILQLSKLEFVELPNMTGLVKAYLADPNSVVGICRKVLKEAERKKEAEIALKNKLVLSV